MLLIYKEIVSGYGDAKFDIFFHYRKLDSSGINSFSSCQMYNVSFPTDDHQWDYENWNFTDHNVVGKYLLRLK